MSRKLIEPDQTGEFPPESVSAGAEHTFVLRRLELDHRYHDDTPVQGAEFTVTFPNGFKKEGALDSEGRATVLGVPAGTGEVRYGPDSRPYRRVDDRENPDHREQMSDQDVDALIDKYAR